MTIQTSVRTPRTTLSLPFGGRKPVSHTAPQHCSSALSERELRRLVAAMID
ncbi:hypothetical protein [Alteraurantiacibacter aestuarii]|uniref:Uncharacterized protein n=1 Tax=Alteraurantiacibacter aestuarii TaxID=650004 RepID=A0A844ZP16_9SPHN|nr:hypothetical protein [Alteraurantiacibacter aestuarii]MXO87389.1 hypothetical protein [Alteraurantiacibacter aestuarii]